MFAVEELSATQQGCEAREYAELGEFVSRTEELMRHGRYGQAVAQMQNSPLETWCGFRPERLREMLTTISRSGTDPGCVGRGMLWFLQASHEPRSRGGASGRRLTQVSKRARPQPLECLAQSVALRMRGRPREALALAERLQTARGELEPLFDTRRGTSLVIALQSGITAMLAGEFGRALDHLAEAQFHAVSPALVCLSRDASAKHALLHASFGDPNQAREALERAARLARSGSWLEDQVDATIALAEALLDTDPTGAGMAARLRALPLSDIGEMWPFYAVALYRAHSRSGAWKDLSDRITVLERTSFPGVKGQGLTGSVFAVIRSALNERRGDLDSALWFLEDADGSCAMVQAQRLSIEVRRGRARRALAAAECLRQLTRGCALRRLDIARYAGLAEAYLQLDQQPEAEEAIRSLRESMIPGERLPLQRTALEFAESRRLLPPESLSSGVHPEVLDVADPLTKREREVLQLLATNLSNAEMAERLFVSPNTLKFHVKGVYRKLGVGTRTAAMLRAEREGLI